MTTSIRTSVATTAMLLAWISTARAQGAPRTPQIGVGGGSVVSWFTKPFVGGDVRLTFPVSDAGDLEVLAGAPTAATRHDGVAGFYAVQFRQLIRADEDSALQPFVTYGGLGALDGRRPWLMPPVIGLIGGGVEGRIGRGVALRVEVQGVVALIFPAGVRLAAGLSVPIGPARR